MDQFTQILSIIAVILTITGAAAAVWAYSMASFSKAQIEALRGDRDDLKERVEILEEDREYLKKKALEKDKILEKANAKIAVLEGIVTHDVAITSLIATVQAHDANVEQHYNDYVGIISQVLQANEHILEKLDVTLRMLQERK